MIGHSLSESVRLVRVAQNLHVRVPITRELVEQIVHVFGPKDSRDQSGLLENVGNVIEVDEKTEHSGHFDARLFGAKCGGQIAGPLGEDTFLVLLDLIAFNVHLFRIGPERGTNERRRVDDSDLLFLVFADESAHCLQNGHSHSNVLVEICRATSLPP